MDRLREAEEILGKENVRTDVIMGERTSFKVGGKADYYFTPPSGEALGDLIRLLKSQGMPFYVVGNRSNLLVSDRGYRGAIIQIAENMEEIEIQGTIIRAQAGALLMKTAALAAKCGLTGLEFACGIPGTIGGAVAMNAGAYGGEIKDIILNARVLKPEGEIALLEQDALELGYRTSAVASCQYIVLEATLQLAEGDPDKIREAMGELKRQRRQKQPLEYPSAGSTFKRPPGHFAGKLIMDAGLAGFQIGGAAVSSKHCGFIVNQDHATAQDIYDLIQYVTKRVREQFDVELEPEIKLLGDFANSSSPVQDFSPHSTVR